MKMYLDCLPCFLKQAIEMARLVTGDEMRHKKIVDDVARMIPEMSFGCTPPEIARRVHQVVEKYMGQIDVYKEIKKQNNDMALRLYPRLKDKVRNSPDPLLTAVEIAIAGNVIDYAAKNTLDIDSELERLFCKDSSMEEKTVFDYAEFVEDLRGATRVLYLADNAGEVVFDRVLIEAFPADKQVTYAVRDKPVINDALLEDARVCGVDQCAQVVSSGVDAPGTILKYCSQTFRDLFQKADIVISKGQGNYEALSEEQREIYFLFRVKCPVIATHAQVPLGDVVLMRNHKIMKTIH